MASNRPTISGTRHVIAAGHYLAAHAGFQILEAGGNAVDAGVCAGICIGVLQTEKVSFGGVAPTIIFRAEDKKLVSIDGLGVWPKAITPDFFASKHGGKIPPGVLRTVVPAAPDAWLSALEHYGTMSFGEVAAAAIRFARDGFPMYPLMAEFIADEIDSYRRWPSSAAVFLPGGKPPVVGALFVQSDLARTLQYLADEEKANARKGRAAGIQAARDAFYKGDIARKIVAFHEQTGGLMRMEDLAEFRVRFEPTVKADFHGIEVHACGPWCQGPTVPIALNLLKGFDLRAMGHNSVEYIHTLTEAFKLAFADRHHYFGDPRFVSVPLEGLLSEAYADERRTQIRPDRAWPEMPPPGNPAGSEGLPRAKVPAPQAGNVRPGDTSYLCVIDRHGNAFSCTPSDGSNNAPVVPGAGFVASGRGTQSWADPSHPCSVAPGKRPRLTPNPALALKDGRALMPFGTPGGDVQCQSMIQVFLNVNVFGMDVQSAIEAPRFSTYSFPGSFEPHPYFPGLLMMEKRIAAQTGEALAARGHRVDWWDEWTWLAGAPCAIVADQARGILHGGADPRRPAYVLGW
ncbi:MAG: gamma-glutamyltransferase family protein [Burkholderiales bacterium]|nr:gamma-glutamyltransferase family protein [Burkholderiales bacterium]